MSLFLKHIPEILKREIPTLFCIFATSDEENNLQIQKKEWVATLYNSSEDLKATFRFLSANCLEFESRVPEQKNDGPFKTETLCRNIALRLSINNLSNPTIMLLYFFEYL